MQISLLSKAITLSDLTNPNFLEEVSRLVRELNFNRQIGDALELSYKIKKALQTTVLDPPVKKEWEKILLELDILAFPFLGVKEQQRVLREHLIEFIKQSEDVKNSFYILGVGVYPFTGNIEWANLREGLVTNEERIGNKAVKDWILDYNATIRKKEKRTKVDRITYIAQKTNGEKVSAEEKEILLKVFDLYDWLQSPEIPLPTASTTGLSSRKKFASPAPPKIKPGVAEAPPFRKVESPPPPPPPAEPAGPAKPEFTMERTAPPPRQPVPPPERPKPPEQRFSMERKSMPSKEAIQQLKQISHEATFAGSPSISQAIVDAGQHVERHGNIRMGETKHIPPSITAKEQKPTPSPKTSTSHQPLPPLPASTPKRGERGTLPSSGEGKDEGGNLEKIKEQMQAHTVDFKDKPTAPAPSTPPVSRSASGGLETSSSPRLSESEAGPLKERRIEAKKEKEVIDLTKKVPLDLSKISSTTELGRIQLADFRGQDFETGLNQIKQKIQTMSKDQSMSVKQAAGHFFRSPLYNLYVNMGTAVMNDKASPDQRTAFEKVISNYQAAKKDYLSREQFLAINKLKKELKTISE